MIFSFIDYTPAVNGIYTFPPWAEAIGWTLTLSSLLYVIGYAAFYLATSEGTLLEVSLLGFRMQTLMLKNRS